MTNIIQIDSSQTTISPTPTKIRGTKIHDHVSLCSDINEYTDAVIDIIIDNIANTPAVNTISIKCPSGFRDDSQCIILKQLLNGLPQYVVNININNSGNFVQPVLMREFAKFIARNHPSLKHINFNCNIGFTDADILFPILHNLTSLRIDTLYIAEQTARLLTKIIKANNIIDLDVSIIDHINYPNDTMTAFLNSIETNKSMRRLRLCTSNAYQTQYLQSITGIISNNKTITKYELGGFRMQPENLNATRHLATLVGSNKVITDYSIDSMSCRSIHNIFRAQCIEKLEIGCIREICDGNILNIENVLETNTSLCESRSIMRLSAKCKQFIERNNTIKPAVVHKLIVDVTIALHGTILTPWIILEIIQWLLAPYDSLVTHYFLSTHIFKVINAIVAIR